MKKSLLLICIIGVFVITILLVSLYMFVLSGAFAIFMPAPPEPQVKYGEFPFTITYEIDNQIVVYRDAVICEYKGVESLGEGGKKRKWSIKLKSGNEYIILLQSKVNNVPFEIYMPIPGQPEYYMGEIIQRRAEYESVMKDDRYLGYKQKNIDRSITKEEVWEQYHIKIIDIECSEPIENKFN